MSLLVGLDTSTSDTCVAVCEPGGLAVAERMIGTTEAGRPRHAVALLGAIEEAVAEAGGWSDVALIAVGVGPGSFTGQRIGIATARAIAQGRGLALAGVRSTEALALGAAAGGCEPAAGGTGSGGAGAVGVIDARRGEVFAERLGADGRGEGAVLCAPERLVAAAGAEPGSIASGEGALRFRDAVEAQGLRVAADGDPLHRLDPRNVCRLGERDGGVEPSSVLPLYLRRPDADRWIEASRGS